MEPTYRVEVLDRPYRKYIRRIVSEVSYSAAREIVQSLEYLHHGTPLQGEFYFEIYSSEAAERNEK